MDSLDYHKILKDIYKEINIKGFDKILEKAVEIDIKAKGKKYISINDIKELIEKYEAKEPHENNPIKNVEVIIYGNTYDCFETILDAIRNNVKLTLVLNDYCIAQIKVLTRVVNNILKKYKFKDLFVDIEDMIFTSSIIENSTKFSKIVVVGMSDIYYELEDYVKNIELNPFDIYEIYFDGDEFNSLKKSICEYAEDNRIQIDIYNDIPFDKAIELMKRDTFGFGCALFTRDEEHKEKFKENIEASNIFINEMPFGKVNLKIKF